MKKYIIFLILVLITGVFVWQGVYVPKEAVTLPHQNYEVFSVKEGEGAKEIAFNLEKNGLIKYGFLFRVYVLTTGQSRQLKAGDYLLSPSLNISQIAGKFAAGEIHTVRITIPEGFNVRQVDERLAEAGIIQEGEIINFEIIFKFQSPSLEGFLFPDTYYFSPSTGVDEIVKAFLDNFDKKLTPELREEIQNQNRTIFDIITMASLIEKEVRTIEDKKIVSGVLWKRLKTGIPLQVDATIAYITGEKTTRISREETKIDSPYNTYKYNGLPKGPICNPGIESILATIYYKDSGYWYYLSTPKGETIFSRTLEEHNINKAKYLN